MKPGKPYITELLFWKYCSILIWVLVIIGFYLSYRLHKYLERKHLLSTQTIRTNIGEPYLMEDSISPLSVTLTSDRPNENGGLSYLKGNTHQKNIEMIHDTYKQYGIQLPKDTKIIFGAGTTVMVAALYYALQKKLNRPIVVTTNTNVFYTLHENITEIVPNVTWKTNTTQGDLAVIVSPSNPLGIVTSPTELREPYKLFDIVYDKNIFTGVHKSVNEEMYREFEHDDTIYITSSFSKFGLAGVRFGYLLTRDPLIAEYCIEYVNYTSVRYPTAAGTITRTAYYKYFRNQSWQDNIYNTLVYRREFFYRHSEKHGISILNKNNKDYVPYIYTDKSVEWWKKKFNVCTRNGTDFNDTDEHSRFNLMISQDVWEEFERRFVS